MVVLSINALMYFLTFAHVYKRERKMTVYSLMIFVFFLFAFMGAWIFSNGIYEDTFGKKNESKLSIMPYIYCYLCMILSLQPLKNFSYNDLNIKMPSSQNIDTIIYGSFVVYFIFFGMYMSLISGRSSLMSYDDIYADAAAGETVSFGNTMIDFLYGKIITLTRIVPLIVYFFLFNNLANQRKIKKSIILIALMFVLEIVPKILNANRGGVFFTTALFFAYLIFFFNRIDKKTKKFLAIVALSGMFVLLSALWAISLSRGGDDSENAMNGMVLRYLGEAYPNLGFNIWGHDINHPFGERYFPSLFGDIETKIGEGRSASFYYWEAKVGIPMLNFKTLFGDLYIEFGVVGAFVFMYFVVRLFKWYFNKNCTTVFDICLYFFYVNTCFMSVFGCSWGHERNWKDLIIIVICMKLLNYYYINRHVGYRSLTNTPPQCEIVLKPICSSLLPRISYNNLKIVRVCA